MSLLSTTEPWDTVAEGYAEVTVGLFQNYSEKALDLLEVEKHHRIADIGCGPGTLSLTAAERVAHVTALDFSEKMIEILRRQIAKNGIRNVEPFIGDGQDLPFDNGVFDAACSMFALMFFPDRAKGFSQLHRTLKPGGRVCVSSWAPFSQSPLLEVMWQAFQTISPDIPDPDPDYDPDSLENPEVLKAELQQAGFEDVIVHRVEGTAELPSAKEYWEGMEKGAAPIVMMKKSMPRDEWNERSKAAIACVEKIAGPFPTNLSATAFLGTGRKPL